MTRTLLPLLAVAVCVSGAGALTYEILWQRQMFLIFGASAPATTAILTAIFLGIAFGSELGRPLLRRWPNPFALFAGLEAVMGIWGLAVPAVLHGADLLYVRFSAALGAGALIDATRFVLAILPLLPATLAMGATIPAMIACVARLRSGAVAWAYGINILGAVVGCLLTGFVWLRMLGLQDTRFVAAGCNATAACLLVVLSRRAAGVPADASQPELATTEPPRLLGRLYIASGFVALGLEVVWLRFLGIVNTNSTATFTLMLAVYLLGMGFGSLALYPLLKRRLSPPTVFGVANGGVACAALATFGILYRAASINQEFINAPSRRGTLSLTDVYLTESAIAAVLLLVPTIFMGLAYPAVCDSHLGKDRDRWVARCYFEGTLGSVLGILVVAAILVPQLGLHGTFCLLVCVSLAICVWVATRAPSRRWSWLVGGGAVVLAGWSIWSSFDPRPVLRETIAVKRGGMWKEVAVDAGPLGPAVSDLLHVKAGATATVMVKRDPDGNHFVYVDDQLVASTNLGAKVDAVMLAHLPLLLHPDPQNALTVGFGTGGTSFAMTTHEVETYCVEIEPEVPKAAGLTKDQNFGVLENPRFALILNDARDHLHAGTRRYDVIATDVTNLQYKQNGNLYTVEYFELMREKLNPGGVACAWIPMASIATGELRTLMRSFSDVFPHATLWYLNHTHTNFGILIGTPQALQIDFERFASAFEQPAIAESLASVGMVDPVQLVHCLHLDEEGYREFCGGAPRHTDDRPILEFSSPLSFYQYYETFRDNLAGTLALRPTDMSGFVVNVPEESRDQFAKHQVASRNFCEVVLLMYTLVVDVARGNASHARACLDEALQLAEEGLAAWPEDAAREQSYGEFVDFAQQRLR